MRLVFLRDHRVLQYEVSVCAVCIEQQADNMPLSGPAFALQILFSGKAGITLRIYRDADLIQWQLLQVHTNSCVASCRVFRIYLYLVIAFTVVDTLVGVFMMVLGERIKRSRNPWLKLCVAAYLRDTFNRVGPCYAQPGAVMLPRNSCTADVAGDADGMSCSVVALSHDGLPFDMCRLNVALLLIHLVCELGTAASVLATLLDERKARKVPVQQYLFFAATLASTSLMTVINIFGFKQVTSFVVGGRYARHQPASGVRSP